MNDTVSNAAIALETLSNAIISVIPQEQALNEVGWGWNAPAATSRELADRPMKLAQRLKELSQDQINEALVANLSKIPQRVSFIQQQVLPNLPGGNIYQYQGSIGAMLDWLDDILPQDQAQWNWESIEKDKMAPKRLLQRLRNLDAQINGIVFNRDEILSKFEVINKTHSAAEAYPAELEELERQRKELREIINNTQSFVSDTDKMRLQIDSLLSSLKIKEGEASGIVSKCEDAYRASTTQGLASAFANRAQELKKTINYLAIFLVGCLSTAAWIGSKRISYIQTLVENKINSDIIVASSLISLLVLAAPIWLAWLATKQISQRFRLSEDYAFKAAFAMAYEGYRTEAINLDHDLSKRLFEAAINRIDESPVRLIDQETPGSPIHELLSRKGTSKVTNTEATLTPR